MQTRSICFTVQCTMARHLGDEQKKNTLIILVTLKPTKKSPRPTTRVLTEIESVLPYYSKVTSQKQDVISVPRVSSFFRATGSDAQWLMSKMEELCEHFNTRVNRTADGTLVVDGTPPA